MMAINAALPHPSSQIHHQPAVALAQVSASWIQTAWSSANGFSNTRSCQIKYSSLAPNIKTNIIHIWCCKYTKKQEEHISGHHIKNKTKKPTGFSNPLMTLNGYKMVQGCLTTNIQLLWALIMVKEVYY